MDSGEERKGIAYKEDFKTRAVDRRGIRYGRLTAIEPTNKRQSGSIVWRCQCDCGNEAFVSAKLLATGSARSCGCLRKEVQAARATDHRGKRYGKLVAMESVSERCGGGVVWRCRCDCGNEVLIRGNALAAGERWYCGKCLPPEKAHTMRLIRQLTREGVEPESILAWLNEAISAAG